MKSDEYYGPRQGASVIFKIMIISDNIETN